MRVYKKQVKIPGTFITRLKIYTDHVYIIFHEEDNQLFIEINNICCDDSIKFNKQKDGNYYNSQSALVKWLKYKCDCYDDLFDILIVDSITKLHPLITKYWQKNKNYE